jgi:hypothetical protein
MPSYLRGHLASSNKRRSERAIFFIYHSDGESRVINRRFRTHPSRRCGTLPVRQHPLALFIFLDKFMDTAMFMVLLYAEASLLFCIYHVS